MSISIKNHEDRIVALEKSSKVVPWTKLGVVAGNTHYGVKSITVPASYKEVKCTCFNPGDPLITTDTYSITGTWVFDITESYVGFFYGVTSGSSPMKFLFKNKTISLKSYSEGDELVIVYAR